MQFKICCDGLCEPRNPGGYACWAYVVYQGENTVEQAYGCIGKGQGMTNNVAEYRAVRAALVWCKENNAKGVRLFTDSMLVVNQTNGTWRIKAEHLLPKAEELRQLLRETSSTLTWHPREENEHADQLSRVAYEEAVAKDRNAAIEQYGIPIFRPKE